jgi:SAM-dependent methyltransferase
MSGHDTTQRESGHRDWHTRGGSFGQNAAVYERTRPGYTTDTVTAILGTEPLTVLDLGAGTGQLTRTLLACGHAVTAVEPDAAMLAHLTTSTPGAIALHGSAEHIPVADESQDGLLISHAYHWFDPEPAHREFARVLRPGGILAALWNLRDESVPWSAELSKILGDEDTGTDPTTSAAIMRHGALAALRSADRSGLAGWLAAPTFGAEFGPVTQEFFPNNTRHTGETLLGLVRSRSYYLTSPPQRQIELERRIHELVANHPDLAGRPEFDLHYVTVVFRAHRSTT